MDPLRMIRHLQLRLEIANKEIAELEHETIELKIQLLQKRGFFSEASAGAPPLTPNWHELPEDEPLVPAAPAEKQTQPPPMDIRVPETPAPSILVPETQTDFSVTVPPPVPVAVTPLATEATAFVSRPITPAIPETRAAPNLNAGLVEHIAEWAKKTLIPSPASSICSYCLARTYLEKRITICDPNNTFEERKTIRETQEKFHEKHGKIMAHMRPAIFCFDTAANFSVCSRCTVCERSRDSFRHYAFPSTYFLKGYTLNVPIRVSKRKAEDEPAGAPPAKKMAPETAVLRRCNATVTQQ